MDPALFPNSFSSLQPVQPTTDARALHIPASPARSAGAGGGLRAPGGSISSGSVGATLKYSQGGFNSAADVAMAEVMLLRAEVAELKASRKIDQVSEWVLWCVSVLVC